MTISLTPDYDTAISCPSPNFGERRDGAVPRFVVLHYTGMETGQGAQEWLCNPQSEVSCHYIVHEDGRIVQMVREEYRAWHAGQSYWHAITDMNSQSIGIEISNGGHAFGLPDFSLAQMTAVTSLLADIVGRHHIVPHNVIAHSDIAPRRKADPGEKFDWQCLAQAGLAVWVEPEPIAGGRYFCEGESGEPIEALQSMLALYGFDSPITGYFDAHTRFNVMAFQRRHRPARIDGVADVSTITTLHRFLQTLPALTV